MTSTASTSGQASSVGGSFSILLESVEESKEASVASTTTSGGTTRGTTRDDTTAHTPPPPKAPSLLPSNTPLTPEMVQAAHDHKTIDFGIRGMDTPIRRFSIPYPHLLNLPPVINAHSVGQIHFLPNWKRDILIPALIDHLRLVYNAGDELNILSAIPKGNLDSSIAISISNGRTFIRTPKILDLLIRNRRRPPCMHRNGTANEWLEKISMERLETVFDQRSWSLTVVPCELNRASPCRTTPSSPACNRTNPSATDRRTCTRKYSASHVPGCERSWGPVAIRARNLSA